MRWSSKYVTFGGVFFHLTFHKGLRFDACFSPQEFKMEAGDDDSWKESPLWRVHVQLPGFTPGLVESISSFTLPLRDTIKWRVRPCKTVATNKKRSESGFLLGQQGIFFRGRTTSYRGLLGFTQKGRSLKGRCEAVLRGRWELLKGKKFSCQQAISWWLGAMVVKGSIR